MSQNWQLTARFFQPPEALRRYFTTFYYTECKAESAGSVADNLHPEWANLRFFDGPGPEAETLSGVRISGARFCATGPSSQTVRFTMHYPTRMWGVGLLPLGWAKFMHCDADTLADTAVDGEAHAAFADFAPLAASLFGPTPDVAAELARLTAYFLARADYPVADEDRIVALHTALIDPQVSTVAQLVERAEVGQRRLERLGHRAFGFSPKLLLRRQRFLRSIAHYVLDPSHGWIEALDEQYHDQPQFVRDFKSFMGMTPSQYAAMDKPVLSAFMRERSRVAGQAVQALHPPRGAARGEARA